MIEAWYDKELDNSNLWGGGNTVIKVQVLKPKSEVLDLVSRINKEVKHRSVHMFDLYFPTEWYAIMLVYCTTNELYTNEGVIDFYEDKEMEREDFMGEPQDFKLVWKQHRDMF